MNTSGALKNTQTLAVTGTYSILVDPSGDRIGSVTSTLYDVPPNVTGSITPGGAAVTVATGTPGQNAQLSFNLTAGQMVSLNITGVTVNTSHVKFKPAWRNAD